MSVLHLASSKNAVYQDSFTAKKIRAGFVKNCIWQLSWLEFSDEDFELSSVTPMEKEIRNQEVPVPSARTPVAREFSGTNKESLKTKMCVHSQNLYEDWTENKERS